MMKKTILLAAALLGATPAFAFGPAVGQDTRIPRMGGLLEYEADGHKGVFIRADTGRWYYASVQPNCPRLRQNVPINFLTAPNGDFDRYSSIRVEGWHCLITGIAESAPPPDLPRHR